MGQLMLTPNARSVLEKRYLKRDAANHPLEKPEDMFRRVASTVAQAEATYQLQNLNDVADAFYNVMTNLDFIPNSPTLMNAGRELGQLSGCYVLPIEDSMDSIFDAIKWAAIVHKSGGGTGFSFTKLRPKGDYVGSTGGVASGPVSFMSVFNCATGVVAQGGQRRGANMGILNVSHPDIEDFIDAKRDKVSLTNFNISVGVTDQFMKAVETKSKYSLINPRTSDIVKTIDACELFIKIAQSAWETGDPGIVFLDEINRYNPTPDLGPIISTNPCGEQPLYSNESCNLGSINLANHLKTTNNELIVDWEKLHKTIYTAVRFLDDVIDINKFPIQAIADMTRANRKIGLGVMGFHDMLIQMGVSYDSDGAVSLARQIMHYIQKNAFEASKELGEERGNFPNYDKSVYKSSGTKVRNATRTTIAPTGSVSIIAGCSSGIEPLFSIYMVHHVDVGELVELNPYFEKWARSYCASNPNISYDKLLKYLGEGTKLSEIYGVPENIKKLYQTAGDIPYRTHIAIQTAFQDNTDNAVSKTINLPNKATVYDVADIYIQAYHSHLKGITIYRDGSRSTQVLEAVNKEQAPSSARPRKRGKITTGPTEMVNTQCGHLYITLNSDEQGPVEIFSHLGKGGGCATCQLEAICRLVSLALRAGVDISSIVKQLDDIRCPGQTFEAGEKILSCPDAIAMLMKKHYLKDTYTEPESHAPAGMCPECATKLEFSEGCFKCHNCGFTKC